MTSENRTTETSASPEDLPLICSARDCREPAAYDLLWNNPKIHTPDRRKHWLACERHRESLSAFLSARSFLREVEDLPAGG